jgi:hypothetical protein
VLATEDKGSYKLARADVLLDLLETIDSTAIARTVPHVLAAFGIDHFSEPGLSMKRLL